MVLTKEEKKAKKQAKLLDKLTQEEEARRQLKRDELRRELTAHARRRGIIDKKWLEMMLKIKEPLFRKDIEIMRSVFERVYDKKDHVIKYIIKLMDIADDQFQRTVASFCTTIDRMINKFLIDLEELSNENDRRTNALLKRTEDESNRVVQEHDVAETHLQLLLYHAHTTSDTVAWTARGENLVKQDEDRSKFEDERENLRSFLEDFYNATWEQYKAVLRAYVLDTVENQKQVRRLRRKENLMADIINAQGKKIASSDGLLKRLRAELAAYESGTKQAVFRDRRNRHKEACFALKKNMCDGIETDMRQLARLVKVSDEAIEWLEAAFNKVEKILRMAALCRKFETRREKVLPFGSYRPHSPTQEKLSIRRQQSDDIKVVEAMRATSGLTRLWQRISKAELTKTALWREKALLEEENAYLMRQLESTNDNYINPESYNCIYSKDNQQKASKYYVKQPVAIDGTMEACKLNVQLGTSFHRF